LREITDERNINNINPTTLIIYLRKALNDRNLIIINELLIMIIGMIAKDGNALNVSSY